MQANAGWIKKVRAKVKACPACTGLDWARAFDPVGILVAPNTPHDHPELPGGMDGKAVLPVECVHCGYVALFSVEHFQKTSPWE
jgi:hypothetical protein